MNTLSIVIPIYNEEQRLSTTFQALDVLRLTHGLKLQEVIFVNDGSNDKTLLLLKNYQKTSKKVINIITYKENKGKGFAVKSGMLSAKGDYALLCDADMSTPLTELKKFSPSIQKGVDVVIGTRKNGKSTVIVHQPKIREYLGRVFTLITQIVLGVQVTDFTCGFKLFSQASIPLIFTDSKVNRWGYDAEIIYLAIKKNLSLVECPVAWSDNKGTHVNVLQAIPQTIFELSKIHYMHTVLPLVASLKPILVRVSA